MDNTDLIQNVTLFEEAVDKMQCTLNEWKSLIAASDGALNPNTSFWYGIDGKWESGIWTHTTIPNEDANIPMKDKNGNISSLRRAQNDIGEETEGRFLSPDGKQTN